MREAAVRGLAKVSEKGNKHVVLAMACLIEEEESVTVKKAAVRKTHDAIKTKNHMFAWPCRMGTLFAFT